VDYQDGVDADTARIVGVVLFEDRCDYCCEIVDVDLDCEIGCEIKI
jgi:hypothetical protein